MPLHGNARRATIVALSAFVASGVSAQQRRVLPEGSVILVRTQQALESSRAAVGQSFETVVIDTIGLDNYTVIPAGSRIRGVIAFVQPATRERSGVIEVNFDRLTLTDGTVLPLRGKLTSTDSAERRQIESDPNSRVVLVGGRSGVGAGIAGAGSDKSPVSSILSALGGLLSEGRDVRLPAGSTLAVRLAQELSLRTRGLARAPDARTVFTAADQIRAAQKELAARNYYRGQINGQLDDATQRALFDFQIDQGMVATGNLDGRTAQALGVLGAANAPSRRVLSADQAGLVRRNAQALAGRERQDLGISTTGRLDASRAYAEADVDLWFALSAFADNASLYEQLIRASGNADRAQVAGRALMSAALRVDTALQQARPSADVRNAWAGIRQQLADIDPDYRR